MILVCQISYLFLDGKKRIIDIIHKLLKTMMNVDVTVFMWCFILFLLYVFIIVFFLYEPVLGLKFAKIPFLID